MKLVEQMDYLIAKASYYEDWCLALQGAGVDNWQWYDECDLPDSDDEQYQPYFKEEQRRRQEVRDKAKEESK